MRLYWRIQAFTNDSNMSQQGQNNNDKCGVNLANWDEA